MNRSRLCRVSWLIKFPTNDDFRGPNLSTRVVDVCAPNGRLLALKRCCIVSLINLPHMRSSFLPGSHPSVNPAAALAFPDASPADGNLDQLCMVRFW